MKKIILSMLFFMCVFLPGYSQELVAVVSDSLSTLEYQIQSGINLVNQLQTASSMVQAQIKTFESLSQGDFDGFVEAFSYQTQVVGQFNNFVDGFGNYTQFEELQNYIDSDSYINFRQQTEDLENLMSDSNQFLLSTNSLVKNTAYRLEKSEDLASLSQYTDSTTGQLQLVNENLALLSQELSDVLIATVAANNVLATQMEIDRLKEESAKKEVKHFYS